MADGFDAVIGDAIAIAVRRAVDDVGRAPLAELDGNDLEAPATGTEDARDVDDGDDALAAADVDELPDRVPPPGIEDPYEILGLPRSASWERIVAAHRRLARKWHPDGADGEEREQREDLIRRLNAAYAELRVRRGR